MPFAGRFTPGFFVGGEDGTSSGSISSLFFIRRVVQLSLQERLHVHLLELLELREPFLPHPALLALQMRICQCVPLFLSGGQFPSHRAQSIKGVHFVDT